VESETPESADGQRTPIEEWAALGDLFALAAERVVEPIEGVHQAIADRWFGVAGSPRLGRAYKASTSVIYGSMRMASALIGKTIGFGAGLTGRELQSPLETPSGSGVQAVANALWGDHLDGDEGGLGITLGIRDPQGRKLGLDGPSLQAAYPQADGRIVLLLHGLGETERSWFRDPDSIGLDARLADNGFSPLLLRYNTGRSIEANGSDLSALIDEVVEHWPVEVVDVSIIGHSMGGLVARSAVVAALEDGQRWSDSARHIIALGSPHLGTPWEKGVSLLSRGLRFLPETKPLERFLETRSAGIRDLRLGSIREGSSASPDAGPDQHFVAGVVTSESTNPIGILLGDLVVTPSSGTGQGRRRTIEATNIKVVGGQNHANLLTDKAVHEQVLEWLASPPAA